MPEEKRKIPRLGKAAGEFNVSTNTIVSLLKKKNLEIEDNPNSKLTDEMYDLLVKEFKGEKLVKAEADKINIGTYSTKSKDSKSKMPKTETTDQPEEPEEPVEENTLIIKKKNIITPPPQHIETEIRKPKVVGSIDLSTLSSHKESAKQTKEAAQVIEEPTPEVVEEPNEVPTPAVEEIAQSEEKPVSQVAPAEITQPIQNEEPPIEVAVESPTVSTPESVPAAESTPSAPVVTSQKQEEPEPAPLPEQKPEEAVANPTPEQPKEPSHIETVVPSIEGPKTLGKIDLSEFNTRKKKNNRKDTPKSGNTTKNTANHTVSKPTSKPAASPNVNRPAPAQPTSPQPTSPQPTKPQPEAPKIEFIPTQYTKLEGPKVLGTITLPTTTRPSGKKDDKRADNQKKKKRKRIIKPTNPKQGFNKDDKKPKQEPEKVEISAEDIQRRIKETKQRLEPIGKSKAAKRRKEKRQLIHERIEEQEQLEIENQKILKVTEFITANELATLMSVDVTKIIATCMSIGLFVSINQRLDAETISMLAEEFGYQVEFIGADAEDDAEDKEEDIPEDLVPRHPIITVMGHVDHGKTSLLDYIRKTNVIAGEAGGITQHIGAYEVQLNDGRKITFLDTPGHEAFTAMRARGAKITDVCIIVIAADDAVMPQTVEAINHAQAAGVPMVFAITKIDKPNANVEKIKEELANMNILVEDWGGQYQCEAIDAKHGVNVNELLEKVLLEAEILNLKANPKRKGTGTVIESSLDKGRGYVAKVLVQNGTMNIGDPVLAGSCYGRVKAMFNERNQPIKSAGPATPLLLLGLDSAPQAGDIFKVCDTEQEARAAATKRARLTREMGLRTQKHITLEEIGRRIAIGDFKELNIIVKGDVDGSVEALSGSLLKLSTDQVQVNVIHKSVGPVTESDVLLAAASNAIIVAFQVRPSVNSRKLAEAEQIDIRIYSIIYTAINEIKDAIAGMHAPEIKEKILCNIEVREVFHISKVGNIAGCMVLDGKLQRATKIRLIRDGIVIYTGKLGSLRRFKDDVKEVVSGQDCGLNIDGCNDIKVGDIIEGYEEYEVAPNANKK